MGGRHPRFGDSGDRGLGGDGCGSRSREEEMFRTTLRRRIEKSPPMRRRWVKIRRTGDRGEEGAAKWKKGGSNHGLSVWQKAIVSGRE